MLAFFTNFSNIPFNLCKKEQIPISIIEIASKYYGIVFFLACISAAFAPLL